jgi:CDP-diacylglycerol---glycerol-3-phosphate 3-phosphatidyltransferase
MKMNLANKITVGRILMVFIFLIVCNVDELIKDAHAQYIWRIVGMCFMILAGFTDILDGYIARKYNMVTDFGKLMDPLADKIFMATAFVMLVDKQCLPGWVAVVILSREFMVTGLRLLAANKGEVIAADMTGKIKTLAQMIFLTVGGSMWVGWINPADARKSVIWIVFYSLVAAFTVYSGIVYFVKHRQLYQEDV